MTLKMCECVSVYACACVRGCRDTCTKCVCIHSIIYSMFSLNYMSMSYIHKLLPQSPSKEP